MRERPKLLFTLEGVIYRVEFPAWQRHAAFEEVWRTPSGSFVTGTIARAMRDDFVRVTSTVYRNIQADYNWQPSWYGVTTTGRLP